MDRAAYHGLPGDFVNTIEPHTEADPAGLLLHFLVSFGSVVGSSPHCSLFRSATVREAAKALLRATCGRSFKLPMLAGREIAMCLVFLAARA